jgi:predicted PurR-regulated permease PerM
MNEQYQNQNFTGNVNNTISKHSDRITSTVQNVYTATMVIGFIAFLFAFIDAAWLTHLGAVDNTSGAVVVGSISLVLFLILLILFSVALANRKQVTKTLKSSLFGMFTNNNNGNTSNVIQPEHINKFLSNIKPEQVNKVLSNFQMNQSTSSPIQQYTENIPSENSSSDFDFM